MYFLLLQCIVFGCVDAKLGRCLTVLRSGACYVSFMKHVGTQSSAHQLRCTCSDADQAHGDQAPTASSSDACTGAVYFAIHSATDSADASVLQPCCGHALLTREHANLGNT